MIRTRSHSSCPVPPMSVPLPTFRTTRPLLGMLTIASLVACDAATSPNATARVEFASPAVAGFSALTADSSGLVITGTNGTLTLTEIRLVVDRLELRRLDVASCTDSLRSHDDDHDDDHACPGFRTGLFVADVPVGTGAVTVAAAEIPAGTYTALKFKVKDLEVDDDDDDLGLGTRLQAVLTQLRTVHPDWPDQASMLVVGTFTPTGGVARPFRVYFDAEIEVESPLAPPVVIDSTSAGIRVDLRPDRWFRRGDGTIWNLALLDFATTRRLVEFETEFEHGVESDHDHDDHDEDLR